MKGYRGVEKGEGEGSKKERGEESNGERETVRAHPFSPPSLRWP